MRDRYHDISNALSWCGCYWLKTYLMHYLGVVVTG